MAKKGGRTFAEAKKLHQINELARENSRRYREIRKSIRKCLQDGPKTIPQIADALKLPSDEVTFYLMTCRKFGQVDVTGIDDMDEYYLYGVNKETKDGED